MSRETIERVRRAYELFDQTGHVELDSDLLARDLQFVQPDENVGGSGVYRGPEAMAEAVADLQNTFDDFRIKVEDLLASDQEVVVLVRLSGRAKQSRVPLDLAIAHLVEVRDGQLARIQVYPDRAEALQAAGLPDESRHGA